MTPSIIWAIAATGGEAGRIQELRNRLGWVPEPTPDRFEARLAYVARMHGEKVRAQVQSVIEGVRGGREYSVLLVWLGDRLAALAQQAPGERRQMAGLLVRALPGLLDWVRSMRPNLGQYDVPAAVAAQEAWHASVAEVGVGPSPGRVVMRLPDGWTVEQLTTRAQLDAEGSALQHCVGTYHTYVQEGRSFIYSLRRDGTPVLTAEIASPATLRQVHGAYNRAPTPAELWLFQQFLLPELDRRMDAYSASLQFNETIPLLDGQALATCMSQEDLKAAGGWVPWGIDPKAVAEGRVWMLRRAPGVEARPKTKTSAGSPLLNPILVRVPPADGSDLHWGVLGRDTGGLSNLPAVLDVARALGVAAPVWGRSLGADPDLPMIPNATWVQVDPVNALEEIQLLPGPVASSGLVEAWPEALVLSLRAGNPQRPVAVFFLDPFQGQVLGQRTSGLVSEVRALRKCLDRVFASVRTPDGAAMAHLLGQRRALTEAELPTLEQVRAMVEQIQPRKVRARILTDEQVALFVDTCIKGLAMARMHGIDPGRMVVEASAGGRGLLTRALLETSVLRLQAGRVVAVREEPVDAERRTGHGKGFRIELRFRILQGQAPAALPLRWTLRGAVAWRRGDRMDRP